jgi:hypothetical protein
VGDHVITRNETERDIQTTEQPAEHQEIQSAIETLQSHVTALTTAVKYQSALVVVTTTALLAVALYHTS